VERLQVIAIPKAVGKLTTSTTEARHRVRNCKQGAAGVEGQEERGFAGSTDFSKTAAHRIGEDEKARLLHERECWTGSSNIHVGDMPWLLAEWLPTASLAVPANVPSGSQDLFLRLPSGVVGFALKAVGEPGTGWADLREELAKAVKLPLGLPYTLVLWSLCLAPQLKEALAGSPQAVFGAGSWRLEAGQLVRNQEKEARKPGAGQQCSTAHGGSHPLFTVPASMQLIITNPHAPTGGGLTELLGTTVLQELRGLAARGAEVDVSLLEHWIPGPAA
jgi:hypothetical protein